MTLPPLVRFPLNPHGRDFAVGDIHGSFSALQRTLDTIGFDPAADRLFSVGDLVDRGPESAQVLSWLAQPWFHAICGNHDLMAWRGALDDPFEDVEHTAHGGDWLYDLPLAEQRRIGHGLAALPMAFEVATAHGPVGLLHADLPSDDWHDLATIDWTQLDRMNSVAGGCLWRARRHLHGHEATVRNVRALVHGHRTLPVMERLGNVYFIDTGGWHRGGRFTLLNLDTLVAQTGPVLQTHA